MRFSALTSVLVLLLSSAIALGSNAPGQLYVRGIFEGARQGQPGQGCFTDLPAGPAESVALNACSGHFDTVYVVKSEGAVYMLTPKGNLEKRYCGLLLRSTIPDNVLAGERPSSPIELRSDGRHFFVKVGNRESEYAAARIW